MNAARVTVYDYQVGGSLPADAPTYVRRKADEDLYQGLTGSEFCYILNSRQMGKSSLRVQTMRRLQAEGIACAAIDLTEIGSQNITPSEWYAGIIYTLASSLELLESFDIDSWWSDRALLSPVQHLSEFIKTVLLVKIPHNIVIFIDEIDSVLSLPFPIEDFFALIRACYNNRADSPDFRRLTFALLGVATPSDLISDKNRTPFNIGRAIQLTGFQLNESEPLARGFAQISANPQEVLKEVLAWTGGQPFLTQKLCQLLLASCQDATNGVSAIPLGSEAERVAEVVRTRIIENWEASDNPEHLRTIRDRLLRIGQRTARLLGLYQQILQYGEIVADDTAERVALQLSGLVVKQLGKLRVYNPIYASVFNQTWVDKALADLRPFAEALASWLASGCQDESRLLRGQALRDAQKWAVGKSLSLQDYQFLTASQELENREIEKAFKEIQKASETEKRNRKEASDAETRSNPVLEKLAGILGIPEEEVQHAESKPTRSPESLSPSTSGNISSEQSAAGNSAIAGELPIENNAPSQAATICSPGTARINLSAFFAPLTKDTFKQAVAELKSKFKVINQTLAVVDFTLDCQGFDAVLQELLSAITLKIAELLSADRASIFLYDEEKRELWSMVAKGEDGGSLEIRIPADKGIAGEVATCKKAVNIPFDFFDDPRSAQAKMQSQKASYRTYTLLSLPVLNEEGGLVAVVQFLNKLKKVPAPGVSLADNIDTKGFTAEDEALFAELAAAIRQVLQTCQLLYEREAKQKAAAALQSAIASISQSSLELEDLFAKLSQEAKQLVSADRSTFWLLDKEKGELWTKIYIGGAFRELRIPRNAGFAGSVAESGEPLLIPFDLYDDPTPTVAKQTDTKTAYRTCSLLCVPVFNPAGELIGVTQLINKQKPGDFPPYDPKTWPEAPECWKASFTRADLEFMQAFNLRAGVLLENASRFDALRQQDKIKGDILRSMSYGVISTDSSGRVVAINEWARQLLGVSSSDRLEGKSIYDVVQIVEKEGGFASWVQAALAGASDRDRRQYYPNQTLISDRGNPVNVNLSITSLAEAPDNPQVSGALLVIGDISTEKRLKSTMYRYMSQDLIEELLQSDAEKLKGDFREVSILFADIRSFIGLTQNLGAVEIFSLLNEYFELMTQAAIKYKGTLDKYIGDAMMVTFGAALPLEEHAWMAVQSAIEMRHQLLEFNARRVVERLSPIKIGIGINSDTVIAGNLGSKRFNQFTVVGDGVNFAARLEGASKQYGCDIVIGEKTYQACAERIWARELDEMRVKENNGTLKIYELVGLRSELISESKQRAMEYYRKGREYYRDRQFARALAEFGKVLEIDPTDKASALQVKRCENWLQEPPPEDWDGA